MEDRLRNGKKVRWLNLIDEYTRECPARIPKRNWDHMKIIDILADLMLMRGTPSYIRSDIGTEFTETAQCVDDILINYEDNAIKFMMEAAISPKSILHDKFFVT